MAALLVTGPFFVLTGVQCASGLDASGALSGAVSWSMAVSPVRVVGNVTVGEGVVLNIKEGTEVLFDEGTHISVEGGTLVVQGIPAAPVRFLPNSASPWKGFYEWIYVNNTPANQASVSVQWAEFSFGVKGLYLDGVQGARIENVRFNNTAEAGIYLASCGNVGVRNCTFTDSDGWGLWAEFSNNLSLSDSVFTGCTASSVLLSDCEYSSVGSSSVRAGSSEAGVQLVNSFWVHLNWLSIEDAITGLELRASGHNTVFSCTFLKNLRGLLLNSSADNLFRDNNFTQCDIPLSFSGGPELATNVFELSNFVDGLPVRAITGGSLDGVLAGAVVLLNCPGSVVSNITFPARGGAVAVLYGGANILRDFSLGGSAGGIVVLGSNGILIENVTVAGPGRSGITLWGTQGMGIRDCRVSGCEAGITFLGPMNISVTRTTLKNAAFDMALSGGAVVRALDCAFGNLSVEEGSRLDEDYTLTVSVRDQNGTGLSGVELQVMHGAVPKYSTPHFGGNGQLSGDGGDFPAIEATAVTILGSARTGVDTTVEVWDGVNAFEWNPRTFRMAAPTRAVFTATDLGFLAGRVLDPAGDPVEGVLLSLDNGANASTGPGGGYSFPPIPPGTYTLNASLSGWQPQSRPAVEILLGQTTVVNLTFDASPGSIGEIRGIVTNGTGAPIFSALVSIGGGKTADTDASGVFRILSAPGGWVNFTVSKTGYVDGSGRAFVPPGGVSRQANVTLSESVVEDSGSLSVRVEDTFGAPLQGARVWLDQDAGAFWLTGGNGTVLLANLSAGTHLVSATLSGYLPGGGNVTVPPGGAAGLTLVLVNEGAPRGTLQGNVRAAGGGALPGAAVAVEELGATTSADASGNYSFASLPEGFYSVTASADGYGPLTFLGVAVAGGSATTQEFVLGSERVFANQSLGVRVFGDFTGPGRLLIRKAPDPPVFPPGGFGRFFQVRASGFTGMTGLSVIVTGQQFRESLAGRNLSRFEIRLYTHPDGEWGPGDRWEAVNDSGYDAEGGFFWANLTHFSVFGIGFSPKTAGPTGTTIIALPPWLSPIAVVAIVLVVAVPIGIIVIRVRQPPSGGGRQAAPAQPPAQRGTNL